MIQEVIEISIPVDLTSEVAVDLVKKLEKKVKDLKENQNEQIRTALKGKKTITRGRFEFREIDVYRKVLDLEVVDKKFQKVEVKPNMASIKEYQKEHRALPKGVDEVFHYSRLASVDLEKKEQARIKRQQFVDGLKEDKSTEGNVLSDIKWQKKGDTDEN